MKNLLLTLLLLPFTGFAQPNGEVLDYYPNGQISRKCTIKNGMLQGLLTRWYPNGQMKKQVSFDKGMPVGKDMQWHSHGQVSSIRFFPDSTTELKWQFKIGDCNCFEDGYPIGTWKFYRETGQLWKQEEYEKGILVKETFYKEGNAVNKAEIESTATNPFLAEMEEKYGPKKSMIKNKYDEKGNLILKGVDDTFGQSYEKYTYDENNNLIRIEGYDKGDKLKNGYSDIAVYEYLYNKKNQLIETRYFDENGNPARIEIHGPSVTKTSYYETGEKKEVQFLHHGQLIEGGLAVIKYMLVEGELYEIHYDSNLTETKREKAK